MSARDEAKNKAEELGGRAKEKVGEVTDNQQWQAEGNAEQTKGSLKQAAEKAKDAVTGNKTDDTKSGNRGDETG